MANELKASGLVAGSTYYATIRNAAGLYFRSDTQVFEAFSSGNFANYAVGAAAANAAGDWLGTFPAVTATSGLNAFSVTLRLRAGGAAAVSDVRAGGPSTIVWDGTAEVNLGTIKAKTDLLTAANMYVVGGFFKGNLAIRQGDSYTTTSGQRLQISKPAGATWPADLTGWTVTLTGKAKADVTTTGSKSFTTVLTVVDPAGVQDLYPDALTATSTAGLAPQLNGWEYTIRAVKNSDATQANTLLSGVLSVAPQLTP